MVTSFACLRPRISRTVKTPPTSKNSAKNLCLKETKTKSIILGLEIQHGIFWGLIFGPGIFWGFVGGPRDFWGVLIFVPIRSALSLEIQSTLPGI